MKRFGREMIWLLLPVVALGTIGYLTRFRKPAVITASGPFTPYIKSWKVLTPRPAEVYDGYDTRVIVEIGATGKKPKWWQDGLRVRSGTEDGKLVARRTGTFKTWSTEVFRRTPDRQPNGVWETEYLLRRRPFPANGGELRLQDMVEIEDGSKLLANAMWLDIPVRKAGEKVPPVVASTDPGIVLKKYELGNVKSSRKGEQIWELKMDMQVVGKPRSGAPESWSHNLRMVDSQGHKGFLNHSQRTETLSPTRQLLVHNFSSRNGKMFCSCPEGHKLVPPLFITGTVEWNEHWPLTIKIPFQDANCKVLVTSKLEVQRK